MTATFTTLEEHMAKKLPRQEDNAQRVDLAGTVKRARLAEMKRRAEWDEAQAQSKERPANPYEALSEEELRVLAGEELTTEQMRALLKERQARSRRRKHEQ